MSFKKSQFIWMALFFLLIVVLFLGVISNSTFIQYTKSEVIQSFYKVNKITGSIKGRYRIVYGDTAIDTGWIKLKKGDIKNEDWGMNERK